MKSGRFSIFRNFNLCLISFNLVEEKKKITHSHRIVTHKSESDYLFLLCYVQKCVQTDSVIILSIPILKQPKTDALLICSLTEICKNYEICTRALCPQLEIERIRLQYAHNIDVATLKIIRRT